MLFVLLLWYGDSRAQKATSFQNTGKYWWYRYRLVNDFMKIGDKCGESIPASERYRTHPYGGNSGFYFWNGTNQQPTLHWGDATEHLGNYIMMLAAEYRMLADNGLSTDRTVQELYYALNAFDRLDQNAEDYSEDPDKTYPCNPGGQYKAKTGRGPLNGFFIRDDVPIYNDPNNGYYDFVRANYQHFNRPGSSFKVESVSDAAFAGKVDIGGYLQPYHTSGTQFVKGRMPAEESQDQLVELYMGTALTTRLVDNWVTYNGKNLARQAGDAEYRLIKYAAEYDGGWTVPKWQIKNPVSTQCVGLESFDCNAGGADVLMNGVGAAIGLGQSARGVGSCSTSDINSMLILTGPAYEAAFQLEQFAPSSAFGNQVNDLAYPCTFNSFADHWRAPAICKTSWWPGLPYPCIKNTTRDVVRKMSLSYDDIRYPHIPMVYEIISGPGSGHGAGNIDPAAFGHPSFPELFSNAPTCGCYNYESQGGGYGNWYWSSPNWSQDFFKRGDKSNADYNNLDYMYQYDLYNLNDKDYLHYYYNSYYRDKFSVPYPFGSLGKKTSAIAFNFLEYLSLINRHASGADITYRGAKVIDLLPGFIADNGSAVNIYVQDYNCDTKSHYFYASINGAEITDFSGVRVLGKSADGADNENNDDTASALDMVPYTLVQTDNPDYDPTDTITIDPNDPAYQEALQHYKDSLLNIVYSSGDDYLISKVESMGLGQDAAQRPATARAKAASSGQISIYPNPTDGQFTIVFPTDGKYDISVNEMMGATVLHTSSDGTDQMNIRLPGNIPAGSYTVVIISDDGKRTVRKITLVR